MRAGAQGTLGLPGHPEQRRDALVEGHDPDDTVVMITYPGPDDRPLRHLPPRIYGW